MKNILYPLFLILGITTFAQNKQILFGFSEVPQSIMQNPGMVVPQKAHYGIPFLSQIHVNGGSSGVSAYDIFREGGDINARIRNKIFDMENTDFFTATEQLEIVSAGWRSPSGIYFSAGMYQEFDFITYFPRDLAILAWNGNQDYLDYEFDLGEISTTGDFMTVYHLGANKQISEKLTLGLRLKVYSSMFSFRSVDNRGTFVTTLGDENSDNIYEHTVKNADITVETSGYISLRDNDGAKDVTNEILSRAFFGGNVGVGVDLGMTYQISNDITLTASALDLGAIFHTKGVENYRAHGTYTLDGVELIFPPLSEGEATYPYYENLVDEIEREIPVDTLHNSYTQFRPAKINVGLAFGLGRLNLSGDCDCLHMDSKLKKIQGFGLQFYSIFRPKGPQMAGTLFYHRKLADFLAAKLTYTADSYSFTNVGLGVAANFGKFNFYLAADNLISYSNIAKAKSVSLQLGLNVLINQPE